MKEHMLTCSQVCLALPYQPAALDASESGQRTIHYETLV